MTAPPILVAAFEPFDGRRHNRSWEAVRRLPTGDSLRPVQLPVDFARLPAAISALLAQAPRALLLVGEARRPLITVEQVALNVTDSDRPDNAGQIVQGRRVVDDPAAPLAVRASWDARAVARLLRQHAIDADPSFHAGTFACNASLYLALRGTGAASPAVGFLHVPIARWPRGPRLRTVTRAIELAALALAGETNASGE